MQKSRYQSRKNLVSKKSRYHPRKHLVSKKSLGIGLKNIWSKKIVTVSVSKIFGLEKKSRSRSRKFWSRKKVSVSVSMKSFGLVTQWSFHYKNSNQEKTLSPSLFKRVCFWLPEISQFCCPEYMEKKSIFRMFCMKSFCSFEYPAGAVLGRWLQFCPCKVRLMRVSALTINNPYGLFRFLIHLGKYGC